MQVGESDEVGIVYGPPNEHRPPRHEARQTQGVVRALSESRYLTHVESWG
jgi:hypothetical protein